MYLSVLVCICPGLYCSATIALHVTFRSSNLLIPSTTKPKGPPSRCQHSLSRRATPTPATHTKLHASGHNCHRHSAVDDPAPLCDRWLLRAQWSVRCREHPCRQSKGSGSRALLARRLSPVLSHILLPSPRDGAVRTSLLKQGSGSSFALTNPPSLVSMRITGI